MDIAKRFSENPILTPQSISPSNGDLIIECLLNPGVFRFNDKVWLLLRVAERPNQDDNSISFPIYEKGKIVIKTFAKDDADLDTSDPRILKYKGVQFLTTLSHLRLVNSSDGKSFEEDPDYAPIFGVGDLEEYGIEDCRVTELDGTFHLTYTQVSRYGVGVGYINTTDWQTLNRVGMIFPPHNKDAAIFDEKVGDNYYAFHRPSSPELGGNYIWLATSKDFVHWGNHKCIITTRPGYWDSVRVGAGASPIKTDRGWLAIYHGANESQRYCLGALLLDLHDPSKIMARSKDPIMEPIMDYEKTGFFGNVVFTNGHLVQGDKLTIYYGASDEVICGAEFSIAEILETLN